MKKLKNLVAKQPEQYVLEALNLVENGKKLLQKSMVLMQLINITIKNYTALASSFTILGGPIMSMARTENGVISIAQYNEVIAFLNVTKSVSRSFSAITLTIIDAVGNTNFMNDAIIKPKTVETLSSLEFEFDTLFANLLSYKNKISNHDYANIYHCLTTIRDQQSANLVCGREIETQAERILGAVLYVQRILESVILAHH